MTLGHVLKQYPGHSILSNLFTHCRLNGQYMIINHDSRANNLVRLDFNARINAQFFLASHDNSVVYISTLDSIKVSAGSSCEELLSGDRKKLSYCSSGSRHIINAVIKYSLCNSILFTCKTVYIFPPWGHLQGIK